MLKYGVTLLVSSIGEAWRYHFSVVHVVRSPNGQGGGAVRLPDSGTMEDAVLVQMDELQSNTANIHVHVATPRLSLCPK